MHRQALVLLMAAFFTTISSADEKPWMNLTAGEPAQHWKGNFKGWSQADSVSLDAKNPRRLSFTPGSAIWVNGEKGRAPDLYTKKSFTDVEIHLEFLIAKGSNSGVKFHGVYEIQIIDSYRAKKLTGDSCGGIYPRAELKPRYHHIDEGIAPKVDACKAPGEWQTLEAIFVSPRFDRNGKKVANARILRATLNGQLIHENQELLTPTGNNWNKKEKPNGPLMLQGDHGPVAFRNVKIRER